jgi:hypothetical protein
MPHLFVPYFGVVAVVKTSIWFTFERTSVFIRQIQIRYRLATPSFCYVVLRGRLKDETCDSFGDAMHHMDGSVKYICYVWYQITTLISLVALQNNLRVNNIIIYLLLSLWWHECSSICSVFIKCHILAHIMNWYWHAALLSLSGSLTFTNSNRPHSKP